MVFGIKKILKRKSPKTKVSEMLLNYAGDYMAMGDDIEAKQQYLNSAVSARNIACLSENNRQRAIKKYIKEYRKLNPTHTNQDCKEEEENIKLLIKEKDRLYPDKNIQIADAEIKEINGKNHVTVMSMRMK